MEVLMLRMIDVTRLIPWRDMKTSNLGAEIDHQMAEG
jgi:hypothetical protein